MRAGLLCSRVAATTRLRKKSLRHDAQNGEHPARAHSYRPTFRKEHSVPQEALQSEELVATGQQFCGVSRFLRQSNSIGIRKAKGP